jgi:hypothetical protein
MPWFVVTARQQITFKLKTEAERIAERIAEAKGIAKGNAYEKPPPLMWAVFFGARRFCRYSGALHQVESFAQRQVRLHEAAAKDIR